MTLTVLAIYLTLVLSIGLISHRLFRGTGEDYFVATRSIGPFVLLMSLFGTHMTAFSLLGASAEAYRQGIGVFALMASSSALVAPAVFYFVGTRLWAVGKRHGYLTQVQYFRERFQSSALGVVLFLVLTGLLIPYLLIGVLGGGISIDQVTAGQVPQWLGSLIVVGVVLTYVTYGGLRGTAWANTFQTLVFMILGAVTFFVIVRHLGGLPAALDRVAEARPELLVRGEKIPLLKLATYTFIPLSVGMFPHIFMHWLSARKLSTFRLPMIAYPLCVAVVWIPSVLVGILGAADFPGLRGPEANTILVQMIGLHAPELIAALLSAGVFAAIMSSLDSQVLSLSTMFTQDIVGRFGFKNGMPEARQVWFGRLFVVAVLLVTYLLSLITTPSIFRLGVWSFTGFAALFPLAVAALYWRRATAAGALSAVLVTALLWIFFFLRAGNDATYTVGGTGIMPVAVIFAASALTLLVVSAFTRPPSEAVLDRFFHKGG
jgi:SSS family solute:Na+ symporter